MLCDVMQSTVTWVLLLEGNTTACNSNHSVNHIVNSSSHSVNGDIAIQWEWSLWPLTESKPLNQLR